MLEPSSLIAPRGPITIGLLSGIVGEADPKSFGKNEAAAALEAYVGAAYDEPRVLALPVGATQDGAARAFVLWKIHLAAYVGMLNRPATVAVSEKGSHGYTAEQIKGMKAIGDQYQAEFDAIVADNDDIDDTPVRRSTGVDSYLVF